MDCKRLIALPEGKTSDDYIHKIFALTQIEGFTELPIPPEGPLLHRELIRAIVATQLNIGMRGVRLTLLDKAFSDVFPLSTRLNMNKKKT